MKISIDLTRKIGGRHLMDETLSGRSLLERLLTLARELNAGAVTLKMPEEKRAGSEALIAKYFKDGEYSFSAGGNDAPDLELDVRHVYNVNAAVKEYRKRGRLDRSIVWTINDRSDLRAAEAELARSEWFPIGRYYIVPAAKALAALLSRAGVTANQVTAMSIVAGLAAAGLLLPGKTVLYPLAGVMYLTFWLFDITDGKLARLKNTVSDFGKWLDPVAGEGVDYCLHLAIVYNLFARSHDPAILWIGIFYFVGKHLTLYLMSVGTEVFGEKKGSASNSVAAVGSASFAARCAHFIHDADIRKHFIAFCICFNIMIVPLVFYAVYYNAWALSKFVLEYARYRRREV